MSCINEKIINVYAYGTIECHRRWDYNRTRLRDSYVSERNTSVAIAFLATPAGVRSKAENKRALIQHD